MAWTSQALLTAIAKAAPGECITAARMVETTGMDAGQIDHSCAKLILHGFIDRTGPGCYVLTEAGRTAIAEGKKIVSGPKGPTGKARRVADTVRERAWRAMRIRSKFSLPELVGLVTRDGDKDPESNVRKYLGALQKAGYLVKLPRREAGTAPTSNGYVRWMLLPERNTGPLAPVWSPGRHSVRDPNTGAETPLSAARPHPGPLPVGERAKS